MTETILERVTVRLQVASNRMWDEGLTNAEARQLARHAITAMQEVVREHHARAPSTYLRRVFSKLAALLREKRSQPEF